MFIPIINLKERTLFPVSLAAAGDHTGTHGGSRPAAPGLSQKGHRAARRATRRPSRSRDRGSHGKQELLTPPRRAPKAATQSGRPGSAARTGALLIIPGNSKLLKDSISPPHQPFPRSHIPNFCTSLRAHTGFSFQELRGPRGTGRRREYIQLRRLIEYVRTAVWTHAGTAGHGWTCGPSGVDAPSAQRCLSPAVPPLRGERFRGTGSPQG